MICPTNIIDIEESNGFYAPKIVNEDECINCGLCLATCSFNSKVDFDLPISSYAGWSKDPSVREQASSGGVAYEFGKAALQIGYKYCGVKYDLTHRRAIHYIADSVEDLTPSLGSKYIPSYTLDAFKRLLEKDKYIVFGTPCQIASLRLLLQKKKIENQFLLIDFYCHGVPSLKVWDKYISENPSLLNATGDIKWRDKKLGWHDSWYIVANGIDGKEKFRSQSVSKDSFYIFFLQHYALAPCCLNSCKFKQTNSSADIRIGDLWGETYKNNEDGVSGILCFTQRGNAFLKSVNKIELSPQIAKVVGEGQMKKNAAKPWGYRFIVNILKIKYLSLSNVIKIYNIAFFLKNIPLIISNIIKRTF